MKSKQPSGYQKLKKRKLEEEKRKGALHKFIVRQPVDEHVDEHIDEHVEENIDEHLEEHVEEHVEEQEDENIETGDVTVGLFGGECRESTGKTDEEKEGGGEDDGHHVLNVVEFDAVEVHDTYDIGGGEAVTVEDFEHVESSDETTVALADDVGGGGDGCVFGDEW
ncbi:hypothetical protein L2E82_16247 [Cichorium intybus]|uniref:Uncharacterized protein n=1 Tax=Cichorium intybus TaxID=13427 RepID=A0ACB9F5I9_CICIN|nr:hypothetical protein L2E82_16247 [Cichorium intybus]